MINIDFYKTFGLLQIENAIERKSRLNNLIKYFLKEYNVSFIPKIEFNTKQDELGSYDPYENKLKTFNANFLTKELTNNDMYEIIESAFHEPYHVKQYKKYLDDKTSYPGFEAALPIGYGYFLQKEEKEAFNFTFKQMQELINSKYNTQGKEKQFYDGLQEYLNKRRALIKESQENEVKALKIRFDENLNDEDRLNQVLTQIKTFAKIYLDVINIEKDTTNLDLEVYCKETFLIAEKPITNKIDLYMKPPTTYAMR